MSYLGQADTTSADGVRPSSWSRASLDIVVSGWCGAVWSGASLGLAGLGVVWWGQLRWWPSSAAIVPKATISYANLVIHKLGFNQNHYTLALILLIKIVLFSKMP